MPEGRTGIKVDRSGRPATAGETHRYYKFDVGSTQTSLSVQVPAGAHWFGLEGNEYDLALEVHTAARGAVNTLDSRLPVAADSKRAMAPVKPGEWINLTVTGEGATNLGELVLIFEGEDLPAGAAALTTQDTTPE